jgi:hypothetical protein
MHLHHQGVPHLGKDTLSVEMGAAGSVSFCSPTPLLAMGKALGLYPD